jgi:cytidylate kinase/pantoate ligase/cytidylate kinase
MVLLNGHDVSREIRSPEVSSSIGSIADNLGVRRLLTQWQRDWTGGKCVVTEGRDQGSEVFPDSPCKIFLSASDDERARRRLNELLERGIQADFATILEQQNRRDCEDRTRPVGTLRRADDAVDICTDGLLLEEVIQAIKRVIAERIGRLSADSSTSEVQRHLASKEGRPT